MKQRFYHSTECAGFFAYEIIEKWEVNDKWYEKTTTIYEHKGLGSDYINVLWTVYNINNDTILYLKDDYLYADESRNHSGMYWFKRMQHIGG